MKTLSKAAPTEEYFPRGKPKGEDKGGGRKVAATAAASPKEKREGRMVSLFGNKENKKVVDKKKKKIKKGTEPGCSSVTVHIALDKWRKTYSVLEVGILPRF